MFSQITVVRTFCVSECVRIGEEKKQKAKRNISHLCTLISPAGFEPATFQMEFGCSYHLGYRELIEMY